MYEIYFQPKLQFNEPWNRPIAATTATDKVIRSGDSFQILFVKNVKS